LPLLKFQPSYYKETQDKNIQGTNVVRLPNKQVGENSHFLVLRQVVRIVTTVWVCLKTRCVGRYLNPMVKNWQEDVGKMPNEELFRFLRMLSRERDVWSCSRNGKAWKCKFHWERLRVMCDLWERVWRYRGADKSLGRPGRKQATATEDFDVHISYL